MWILLFIPTANDTLVLSLTVRIIYFQHKDISKPGKFLKSPFRCPCRERQHFPSPTRTWRGPNSPSVWTGHMLPCDINARIPQEQAFAELRRFRSKLRILSANLGHFLERLGWAPDERVGIKVKTLACLCSFNPGWGNKRELQCYLVSLKWKPLQQM